MTRTKIEWADFTFNPIVGCRRGCSYCYAKRLNDRFKWIENWKEPKFYPERLHDPDLNRKKPAIIFVGSMCDMIADVTCDKEQAIVQSIIEECGKHPQHIFMFLTKRPMNYRYFNFPENIMLGTSIEEWNEAGHKRYNELHLLPIQSQKFVSFEPLMGLVYVDYLPDLVIVGAMTGVVSFPPKREWLEGIKHHPNIFYKENIRVHFPDLPKGSKEQIWLNR